MDHGESLFILRIGTIEQAILLTEINAVGYYYFSVRM